VSPNLGTSAPSLLTSIPAKVDTEPPSRTTGIGRESQPPELLSRRGMSTSERSANPKPVGDEVKAGVVLVSKGSGSPHRRASAPSLARSIPCKMHPKPPSESTKLDTESQAPELSPPTTISAAENNVVDKVAAIEVQAGARTSTATNLGPTTDDSNPSSMEGAIDGLLEVGGTPSQRSPRTEKKAMNTPVQDESAPLPADKAPCKVRSSANKISRRIAIAQQKKLLVFNIHGTLLDCSLLIDKNPNTAIRPTLTTDKHRVIFRPGLIDFLTRCFMRFDVAFWGTKSEMYMREIVPAILGRMKDGSKSTLVFVWSTKECEVTKFEDGIPIA
jgi:hypothetical protein